MKVIIDPIHVVPNITERDVNHKAILTVMSKYLQRHGIIYIGIADRIDSSLVGWFGYCDNNTDTSDYDLSKWYHADSLIELLLIDKRTYGPDVYFPVLETEQDLIEFQKHFPNLNINMITKIRRKLGLPKTT